MDKHCFTPWDSFDKESNCCEWEGVKCNITIGCVRFYEVMYIVLLATKVRITYEIGKTSLAASKVNLMLFGQW
ncbi:hypothetical protein CFP56_029462 [Quercus suber]|uniref:Leucine-rich repeat-containing N-terminal plant-type domain-containing protein n=1 Tax=Quercus suber TaxID=58331 RepID=A0AAW0JSX9_QUESU